jgi:tetratricopeptide (TPR) repeat protein
MEKASQYHDTYIRRREEAAVRAQVDLVRAEGRSRAVLLYGAGGVGKTRLVRALAREHGRSGDAVWVTPIDVDDSEYWLLATVERVIASTIDPHREHFGPYFEYLSRLPRHAGARVGYQTVVSHLGGIKHRFVECYQAFIQATKRTVVVTLDTVEAIRSTYLLLTITQWMKLLPRTLFIMSGRPVASWEQQDPIRERLADPHRPMPCTEITLSGFDSDEAMRYLDSGPLRSAIEHREKERLVALTRRHPLWLALSVDFLQHADAPPELTDSTQPGEQLHEAFRRRLVAPYRSTEFWPEAIKRLAVLRHGINQDGWQRIMADRDLPPNVGSWDQAWNLLLGQPWVRPRANNRYVTLHDALAEELAQRLIPLHDRDETWRHRLWRRATDVYAELTAGPDERVQQDLGRLAADVRLAEAGTDSELIALVDQLDAGKRELDQLKTAWLHYQLLSDFPTGTDCFIMLYGQASARSDVLLQELICHEVKRFLPHGATAEPARDVLGVVVQRFHRWLAEDAPVRHLEIGLSVASFLTQNGQPDSALTLLRGLPAPPSAEGDLQYQLANELGNACMRIPDMIHEAGEHFQRALDTARDLLSPDKERREAQARKEFGCYYGNLGLWGEADESYLAARDLISGLLGPGSPERDREEMASIQTSWAYLKARQGSFEEARHLVDSAVAVRRRLGRRHGIGVSLSVSGEVYRYDGKFTKAWDEYVEAERVFLELTSWPWLGVVYQQQAICLYQADREGISLVSQPLARARDLIRQALDICRNSVRSHPSALNRAARIFGIDDIDIGLRYFDESINEARRIGDGRLLCATLIEFLELSYRAWRTTGGSAYRALIDQRIADVSKTSEDYSFPDLLGRWKLLQGHLAVHDALDKGQLIGLDVALAHYSEGFAALVNERVGPHGTATISAQFHRFRELFTSLPASVQRSWYSRLRSTWSMQPRGRSTSLLARLEELY